MELELRGKIALVTGGAKGIGAGISESLATEGVTVAVNYCSDAAAANHVVSALNTRFQTGCFAVYADVTVGADLDRMVKTVLESYGRIDILVNNAGIWPTEHVLDTSDRNWKKVIDVCLNAPFMLGKRVAQTMIEDGTRGVIVNLSSKSAVQYNTSGHGHYASAKAGLNMLTRVLARELAPHGIRVIGVAPGMVRTPMNEGKWQEEAILRQYLSRIPVGRFAEAKEIGQLVAFLASDQAKNITGTTLDTTGGMLI